MQTEAMRQFVVTVNHKGRACDLAIVAEPGRQTLNKDCFAAP